MNMSAVEACKQAGLSGLNELARHSQVSRNTLYRWHSSRPKVFRMLVNQVVISKAIEVLL